MDISETDAKPFLVGDDEPIDSIIQEVEPGANEHPIDDVELNTYEGYYAIKNIDLTEATVSVAEQSSNDVPHNDNLQGQSGICTIAKQISSNEGSCDERDIPSVPPDFLFNKLLMDIAISISNSELIQIKSMLRGDGLIGEGVLQKVKSASELFRIMRQMLLISRENIVWLQAILRALHRPDLAERTIEYSKISGNVLHFFEPPGQHESRFHVEGNVSNLSKRSIERLRTEVADLLCVPYRFVIIAGVEPSSSFKGGSRISEQRDTSDIVDVDPRYYNAYIDALKDGIEKTNTIRINVVGNAWVGKSTLTKKLLGMIPDRNIDRTDGIEVHYYTCNDSSDWSSKDVSIGEKTALRIAISSDAMKSKEQPIKLFDINTSHIEHQPNQTEIKTPGEPYDDEIVQVISQTSSLFDLTIPTDELKINETEKERINIFSSKLKEGQLTDVKCIQIWDFGGQFDYYATHQLFHSHRAVYLLVLDASADLNDITETCEFTNASRDKDVKYFCKFWMHSIHSFVGNDKNEPPVILVATKTDKKPGWNQDKHNDFFESVRKLFDGSPVGYHIQPKCFSVNNFSEDATDFKNLRQYIEEVANGLDSLNSTVPARWIPLEDSLRRLTAEKHITLQQIMTIGSELNVPINDELQIKAFLMYHHALGNLVYFDDDNLSESIVIDPQWIIDAFKTIITAKAKQYCLENGPLRDKWEQLTKNAILSRELIKAVWNIDDKNDFSSNEDILLKYLIKLGIIAEVTELDLEKHIENHKDYFLVPSLLNGKSSQLCLDQLMEARTVTQTALVFAFEDNYVPLMLHHRLTAAALGKWNVLVFRDQRMLTENIGVYELDEVHAGMIEVCDTSIEIKVFNLCGKNINPTQTDKLRRFVCFNIDAEFQRFSKTKTSPYTLRIRCNFNNNKGKQTIDFSKIENSEYDSLPCPDKDPGHDILTLDFRNQWSYPGVNISRNKNEKELLKSIRDDSRRDFTLLVTEREFSKVAYALGFNWELLGIDLGLSNANIEQIKMDNPCASKAQIFQMLKTWGEREAEEASMEKLLAAIVGVVDLTVDWDQIRNILDE